MKSMAAQEAALRAQSFESQSDPEAIHCPFKPHALLRDREFPGTTYII